MKYDEQGFSFTLFVAFRSLKVQGIIIRTHSYIQPILGDMSTVLFLFV